MSYMTLMTSYFPYKSHRMIGLCAFVWYQNHRPWMTLNCGTFKFSRNFALVGMFRPLSYSAPPLPIFFLKFHSEVNSSGN